MQKFAAQTIRQFSGLDPFPQPQVVPTRYPVVLMHGFGMLAGLRRGGHLHLEALHLRRHGVLAYAPNVAPYNTVRVRAQLWKQRFEHILAETGADCVSVIAHSMGGLDARYLISEVGLHAVVPALVTVATPHRGTAICDLVHEQPARMQAWATQLFNWIGSAAMEEVAADVAQAVAELTPVHMCERFNTDIPDHPGVRYWSYGGAAGKGTDIPINPFLLVQNGLLHKREGVNDGFVSVESAQWGTYLGTLEADHAQQVGINLLPGRSFVANDFYLDVVRMLAEAGY